MLKLIKKLFGIGELTTEEKIIMAEKNYQGLDLVTEILRIEGFETSAGLPKSGHQEDWYYRLIDLCAKYQVDFPIPG